MIALPQNAANKCAHKHIAGKKTVYTYIYIYSHLYKSVLRISGCEAAYFAPDFFHTYAVSPFKAALYFSFSTSLLYIRLQVIRNKSKANQTKQPTVNVKSPCQVVYVGRVIYI